MDGPYFAFRILPAYYQTWWFTAICLAIFVALIALLYIIRLRQVSQQLRLRAEERLYERERIARDLHDTLLQGTQCLVLSFQVVATELPVTDPLRGRMEGVLDQAEQVIAEAREKVLNLRSTVEARMDLSDQISIAGAQACAESGMTFKCIQTGTRRPLQSNIVDEICAIARKALVNASRHSRAKSVDVELQLDSTQHWR